VIFRALGALEIHDSGGQAIVVTGRKQRILLAALLARTGEWVRSRWLVDALWGGAGPRSAASRLKTYVWELRRVLPRPPDGGERIEGRRGEYRIVAGTEDVDLLARTDLAGQGRQAATRGDLDEAIQLFGRAIDLRRGEFAEGLDDSPALVPQRVRLAEEHWTIVEDWVGAHLSAGRHIEVVQELRSLIAAAPMRERLWEHLMVGLYRSGRRAEAITTYREAYDVLARELGVTPGVSLRQVFDDVLRDDPALHAPQAATRGTPQPVACRPPVPPANLPADLISFTGRTQEIDEVLSSCLPNGQGRAAVCAIDGMAGVGKTTLAVHAAHRLAPRFPDGQLFLDLHGFTEGVAPMDAAAALSRLLRALAVSDDQIPRDMEDRAAMYRSLLSGQRVLILLDNVADEGQVTPLIPAEPGCLVLVTGRRRLTGVDDIQTVSLDIMPLADALDLFARVVGDRRAALQPAAAEEVVGQCGLLPLAIRIAAVRLKARPAWTVAHLADRLRDQQHRLAELEAGQRSVAAALRVSYEHLSTAQKGMFRLLGLHPGTDFDAHAAAAMADLPAWQADALLESLVDLHLLLPAAARRYQLHDLIRQHARVLATGEPPAARNATMRRLLNYWANHADAALRLMQPEAIGPDPSSPTNRGIRSVHDAVDWLDVERRNLMAGIEYAAEHDLHSHTVRLARCLGAFFGRRGYPDEWRTTQILAVGAARRLGNLHRLVHALENLSWAHLMFGDNAAATACIHEASSLSGELDDPVRAKILNRFGLISLRMGRCVEALAHQREALSLYTRIGDVTGQAKGNMVLGLILLRTGDYAGALRHADVALALNSALGLDHGRGDAINVAGLAHLRAGDYERALGRAREALSTYDSVRDERGRSYALYLLGAVHSALGQPTEAMAYLAAALTAARRLNDEHTEAHTLGRLGTVHRGLGKLQQALDHHQRAVTLARRSGDQALECEIVNDLAETWYALGHPQNALHQYQYAVKTAEVVGDPFEQARGHHGIAQALHALGEHADAGQHLEEAAAGYHSLGVPMADGFAAPPAARAEANPHSGLQSEASPSS
jgi:DNA-binding SARP family transcriptional activator